MDSNKDKKESLNLKKNEVKRNKSKEKSSSNAGEFKRSFFGSRRKKKDLSKENSFNGDQNGAKSKGNTTQPDAGLNVRATNEIENFEETPQGALMVTEPHAEEYFMDHEKRGKAIIFNHEIFEKEDPREGTHKDVDRIKHVFGEILKFEVEVHNDLEFGEILSVLATLSKVDYKNCDCIAIFVLSHGKHGGDISAKDIYYPVEKLWNYFTGDKCPTLAGKPKLFFLSACRGKKKDSGIRLFRGRTQTDSSNKPKFTYKLPNQADFLIASSTAEGYYSYRDIYNGTWFIECLCNVIQEHHEIKDLVKMLTITQRKVAIDYRTISDKVEDHDFTQIPSVTTMLIRDVYFRSKQ